MSHKICEWMHESESEEYLNLQILRILEYSNPNSWKTWFLLLCSSSYVTEKQAIQGLTHYTMFNTLSNGQHTIHKLMQYLQANTLSKG